jgi:hypothetical protein
MRRGSPARRDPRLSPGDRMSRLGKNGGIAGKSVDRPEESR